MCSLYADRGQRASRSGCGADGAWSRDEIISGSVELDAILEWKHIIYSISSSALTLEGALVNGTRGLVLVLVALVVIDLSWTAAVDHRASNVEDRVEDVAADQRDLAAFAGASETSPTRQRVTVPLYAYDSAAGEALAVPARVTTIPADGIYLNVGEVAHTATVQASIETAWTVANESASPPAYRGVVVNIAPPQDWDTVGGGSAALAMALGFAETNPCVDRRSDVHVTGGLTSGGTVVEVDHVEEKARAAAARNASVFVVPDGQGVAVSGIEVVEVTSFDEAAAVSLERNDSCDVAAKTLASASRVHLDAPRQSANPQPTPAQRGTVSTTDSPSTCSEPTAGHASTGGSVVTGEPMASRGRTARLRAPVPIQAEAPSRFDRIHGHITGPKPSSIRVSRNIFVV